MRRSFWVLMGVLLARLVGFSAGSVTVTVPGTAGPWTQSLNPSFNYGVHDNDGPVVIDASTKGITFVAGETLTIRSIGGTVSAGILDHPFQDANGEQDYPTNTYDGQNGRFPAFYMAPTPTVYLVELVGTFAKDGVIVGVPFAVGDGPTQLTIPMGASQLLLGINDNLYKSSNINGGSFTVAISSGCQVNVQPTYSQCSNPWGTTKYDSDASNRTMCMLGCATTALTMALGAGGVLGVPSPINGFMGLDPGSLNLFMDSHGGDYIGTMVQFEATTSDVGFATTALTGGKTLYFDDSLNGGNNPADLKSAVCDGHAVIVKVSPIAQCSVQSGPPGGHYVLVTGEHDDASGNPHFDIADPGCELGFGSLPPIKSLDAYNNIFEMRGFVSDPTNISMLEVVTDANADLRVTDSAGNHTGANIKQIPRSSYAQDFLTDNTTGLPATGITHSINLFEPLPELYDIEVTGLQPGIYSLTILPYSSDGTPQARFSMIGLGEAGATSMYQIQYNPAPGAAPQVSLSPSSRGSVPPTEVATTASGLAYSRVSQTFNGTVTIKNIGGIAINGPFQIFFSALTSNVTLANATSTFIGMPYLTVPSVVSLAPDQSATVNVQFKNPSNARISFTPAIYSGHLN